MDAIQQTTLFPFEKAFRIVTRRADVLLNKMFGCGRREMWILLCITTNGRSQREIGECVGLHPNVVVKLLDGMEENGFVRRVRRPEDRREQTIAATEKGTGTLEKYLAQRGAILEEIFAPLTAAQRERWRDLSLLIVKGASSALVVALGVSQGFMGLVG